MMRCTYATEERTPKLSGNKSKKGSGSCKTFAICILPYPFTWLNMPFRDKVPSLFWLMYTSALELLRKCVRFLTKEENEEEVERKNNYVEQGLATRALRLPRGQQVSRLTSIKKKGNQSCNLRNIKHPNAEFSLDRPKET
jgi:hypothetical protein